MKKLGIIALGIGLVVAFFVLVFTENNDDKPEKRTKRKDVETVEVPVETPVEIPVIEEPEEVVEKVVHVKYTTVSTDSSYWYVVMKDEVTNWHGTVEFATPYFDFNEAKKQFKGAKGKCYFKFIVEINKESVPSFYTYND